MKEGIVLIILGAAITIFSHPKMTKPSMSRLFNEGLVTPRREKPEKTEVIKGAGPHLSLFIIGVILIILGAILMFS